MSMVAELELERYGEAEAAFAHVARRKGWLCKVCGETPLKDEFDAFYESDFVCPHCQAHYERFMRD